VGSLPWETVLHELLQRGSFPRGAVLQEQAAPAWVPKGSQVLPANLLQSGLPTGSQPPPVIPLLRRGVLPGLQVGLCSPVGLHGLQGHSLSHHGLLHRLQGNLCSGTWSTSCLSLCTDSGVSAGLVLSHSLTPFSGCKCHYAGVFFLLNYVIPEVLPPSLMGLALVSGASVL